MLSWQLKKFKNLSNRELFDILKLRQSVFVVEQECPYPDIDDVDLVALHLIGLLEENDQTEIAAYARLVKPGVSYQYASIGRVIIAPSSRGKDFGRELMKKAISETKANYPGESIKIGAQERLEHFYHSLGFETHSEMYVEDGIPHIEMLLPHDA